MVCEKNRGTDHDFANDPISLVREEDWLSARRNHPGGGQWNRSGHDHGADGGPLGASRPPGGALHVDEETA